MTPTRRLEPPSWWQQLQQRLRQQLRDKLPDGLRGPEKSPPGNGNAGAPTAPPPRPPATDWLATPYDSLTPPQRRWLRQRYADAQEGLCWYCHAPLADLPPPTILAHDVDWTLFPRGRGFLDHPLHLHHDHITGLTVGTVHAYCNAVLFQYDGR